MRGRSTTRAGPRAATTACSIASPAAFETGGKVACSITVKDDLIAALGTGYDVTDTFHLTFEDGRITAVRNSSNDPPEFEQAQQWLETAHPEILAGPCRDAFGEGKTPQQCVRAVVKAFAEFAALDKR